MKQYDKNSLIGLLLMGFILIIFNTYFFPQSEEVTEKEVPTTVAVENYELNIAQKETEIIADAIVDSIINKQYVNQYGIFANTVNGKEHETILENEKIKIFFFVLSLCVYSIRKKKKQSYKMLFVSSGTSFLS